MFNVNKNVNFKHCVENYVSPILFSMVQNVIKYVKYIKTILSLTSLFTHTHTHLNTLLNSQRKWQKKMKFPPIMVKFS
jgi:hypothetical protein